MNRLTAALAAAASIFATAPAAAGQLVDVAVINRATGQRIPLYTHQGRLYVPGTPGERYAVYVANRTGKRVMTVVSVDGINVVTGETASPDQNGYVLAPGQSFEINGWRKSMNEVAAFYFTRLPDSYAARTDRPEHVGVIGVAAFREWQRPRPAPQPMTPPLSKRDANTAEAESRAQADAAAGAPAASAPAEAPQTAESARGRFAERQEKIGTGHGARERSDVVYTNFRRATSHPNETLTIYYDTHANLVARGVIPRPTPLVEPNPFPGGRFVPDPRG
jgi:hypothetical protein